MLEKPGRNNGFDPKARKSKDNARQRKIMSNSSDKASRKNAPRIKAMEARKVRRADHMTLDETHEHSADQIKVSLKRRNKSWGTVSAAQHRADHAKSQKEAREAGGRLQLQRKNWNELARSEDSRIADLAQSQIQELDLRIAQKTKGKQR